MFDQFLNSGYYVFIALMLAIVIAMVVAYVMISYDNKKQRDIITKRIKIEIDNVELIRSLRKENDAK